MFDMMINGRDSVFFLDTGQGPSDSEGGGAETEADGLEHQRTLLRNIKFLPITASTTDSHGEVMQQGVAV